MLKKQAKILSDKQIQAVLGYLSNTKRNSERNKVIFLLSLHGLRSKEIANLELSMVTDAEGNISSRIALHNKASKGKSGGRVIAINDALKDALEAYMSVRRDKNSKYVVTTERREKFSANAIAVLFQRLYKSLGFDGASSHSGRRTFITKCARNISHYGGSLKDVMNLAGHRNLSTTQLYVECDPEAQKKLVSSIYKL